VPVVLGLVLGLAVPWMALGGTNSVSSSSARTTLPTSNAVAPSGSATSIGEVGTPPGEVVVGTPLALSWQALGPGGARVTSFAAAANLTVTASSNGSNLPAWVNSSISGPLHRSANGTFSVPASAWSGGVVSLTVSVAAAAPITVRLGGTALPGVPAPIAVSVQPDLDHLVIYDPAAHGNATVVRTFWLVRDRFGDPAPGAFLYVAYATDLGQSTSVVPVNWTVGGATGAWVNYSAPQNGTGTLRVTDAANDTLLGLVVAPVAAALPPPAATQLSPMVVAAVALLAVGAVVGMVVLVFGGRVRPNVAAAAGEEDLRRLAEGRATVVEIVREGGPLGIAEIEARWEPPPAPAAVSDWVASLVTDGTLTATIGEGGRARFAVASPPADEPRVTLDEDALEREIARRDAAVDDEESERA
jgi:hypothetical protein